MHSGSVALVINPATGHVSPQFYVVLDDDSSTVTFIREGKMPLNWTDFVQCSSQIISPENIDLKDTWFTPDLEEDPRKTPIHEPSVAPDNNNNMIAPLQYVPHLREIPVIKGAPVSELIKYPSSEVVQNT